MSEHDSFKDIGKTIMIGFIAGAAYMTTWLIYHISDNYKTILLPIYASIIVLGLLVFWIVKV